MINDDDWLTVQDATKLSSYNADHLRELIRDGKINARKFSIVWMVSRKSLLKYLKKMKESGKKRGPKPRLSP